MSIKFNFKASISLLFGFLFLTNSCKKDDNSDFVTDIDGNIYHTVTIGNQVWMVENLKTTRYRNGNLIGTTNPATKDIAAETAPKYQWAYNGNESNVNTYGRLYTWYTVNDDRKIAPAGWHVATKEEWDALIAFAGGNDIAGNKLKEKGSLHWSYPNPGIGTDDYGFKALPGGGRLTISFGELKENGLFWTSTATDIYNAWVINIPSSAPIDNFDPNKNFGYAVRCVKGE